MLNFALKVVLVLVLLAFRPIGAQAQETETGTGLICDTKEQVEQFVKLSNEGLTNDVAVHTVNAGTSACGVVSVAFLRGEAVGRVRTKNGQAEITAIVIIAFHNGLGFVPITPPLPQFTLFLVPGEDA